MTTPCQYILPSGTSTQIRNWILQHEIVTLRALEMQWGFAAVLMVDALVLHGSVRAIHVDGVRAVCKADYPDID